MAHDTIVTMIIFQFLIPRFVAEWVQSILYSIFIRAGDPKPAYRSPKYIMHRKQILITIYAAYFLFTIYEINHDIQSAGNLYKDLGVALDVDDRGLNGRLRQLAREYHPDKVHSATNLDAANDFYVHLKNAKEIIVDPVKRFAYDRFGPTALQCGSCLTARDYVAFSLMSALFQYAIFIVCLAAANTLGFFKEGAYWRYLALFALITVEVRTALRPDHPAVLVTILNPLLATFSKHSPYLPFQAMALLQKGTYSLSIFLTSLIALHRGQPQKATVGIEDSEEARHMQLDRLTNLAKDAQMDATRLLDLEFVPFKADQRLKGDVRNVLQGWMVRNVIHSRPEVHNALEQAFARRRAEASAGAQGTT